jgi:hypothetical protein
LTIHLEPMPVSPSWISYLSTPSVSHAANNCCSSQLPLMQGYCQLSAIVRQSCRQFTRQERAEVWPGVDGCGALEEAASRCEGECRAHPPGKIPVSWCTEARLEHPLLLVLHTPGPSLPQGGGRTRGSHIGCRARDYSYQFQNLLFRHCDFYGVLWVISL